MVGGEVEAEQERAGRLQELADHLDQGAEGEQADRDRGVAPGGAGEEHHRCQEQQSGGARGPRGRGRVGDPARGPHLEERDHDGVDDQRQRDRPARRVGVVDHPERDRDVEHGVVDRHPGVERCHCEVPAVAQGDPDRSVVATRMRRHPWHRQDHERRDGTEHCVEHEHQAVRRTRVEVQREGTDSGAGHDADVGHGTQIGAGRDPVGSLRDGSDQRGADGAGSPVDHGEHHGDDQELPEGVHQQVEQRYRTENQAEYDEQRARTTAIGQMPQRHRRQQPEQPRNGQPESDLSNRQPDDPVEIQHADRHQQPVAHPTEQRRQRHRPQRPRGGQQSSGGRLLPVCRRAHARAAARWAVARSSSIRSTPESSMRCIFGGSWAPNISPIVTS